MLLSMTGFATKTAVLPVAEGEETQLIVEIKSLNSRYFESTCKLPSSLNFLEMSIINTLKEKLVRGRVFVLVKLSTEGGSFERVIPVMKVVKDYLAAAETIKKTGNVQGELALSNILTLPNVFASEREELGAEKPVSNPPPIASGDFSDKRKCGRKKSSITYISKRAPATRLEIKVV